MMVNNLFMAKFMCFCLLNYSTGCGDFWNISSNWQQDKSIANSDLRAASAQIGPFKGLRIRYIVFIGFYLSVVGLYNRYKSSD